jgi:hypothetical protein
MEARPLTVGLDFFQTINVALLEWQQRYGVSLEKLWRLLADEFQQQQNRLCDFIEMHLTSTCQYNTVHRNALHRSNPGLFPGAH